jgi:hypothetical protein
MHLRGYARTRVELGSSLDDVHARTSRGRKRWVLRILVGSDLELASRCAVTARGSAGHIDGLEKLDGGNDWPQCQQPWHRAAWLRVLRRLSDGQP